MQETQTLLECRGLGHDYGKFRAVGAVDLALRRRSIHALIGPNGAGKTTFFNVVSGRLQATRGSLRFAGCDLTHSPSHERIRHGMARSFQITSLFQQSTVADNLRLAWLGADRRAPHRLLGRPDGPDGEQRVDEVLRALSLAAHRGRLVSELSHGLQRVLEIGMCLMPRPAALLLDEPLAGLGLADIPRVSELLVRLKEDHAILLVEHNMRVVMSISDEVTVMFEGNVLASGAPHAVRTNADVARVYLGSAVQRSSK